MTLLSEGNFFSFSLSFVSRVRIGFILLITGISCLSRSVLYIFLFTYISVTVNLSHHTFHCVRNLFSAMKPVQRLLATQPSFDQHPTSRQLQCWEGGKPGTHWSRWDLYSLRCPVSCRDSVPTLRFLFPGPQNSAGGGGEGVVKREARGEGQGKGWWPHKTGINVVSGHFSCSPFLIFLCLFIFLFLIVDFLRVETHKTGEGSVTFVMLWVKTFLYLFVAFNCL